MCLHEGVYVCVFCVYVCVRYKTFCNLLLTLFSSLSSRLQEIHTTFTLNGILQQARCPQGMQFTKLKFSALSETVDLT